MPGLFAVLLGALAANAAPQPIPEDRRPAVLTLSQAIEEALARDPRHRAEAEAVRQAEADLRTAGLAPNPAFSLSKGLIPFGTPFTAERPGGPGQLDLELSYPLDQLLFGKRGAAVASARLGVEEARAVYEDVRRQRRAEVAVAFVDVLEAKGTLELAREDASDLERIQKIAQERVRLGGAAPLEADRIAVAVLEARREARQREVALGGARGTLAVMLGREGPAAEFEVSGELEPGALGPPPEVSTLLATARERRPDVRARSRAVERAAAEVRLERRRIWPELTPSLVYSRQYQRSLGSPDVSAFGFGVELQLPLLDRNQGNVGRSLSAQAQRELELRAALVALRAEVEQARREYTAARQALLDEDRAQLEAAERVRERVRQAYELGGRPLLEVIDSQKVYRDASRQALGGRAALWRTAHRLNAAVGMEVVP